MCVLVWIPYDFSQGGMQAKGGCDFYRTHLAIFDDMKIPL